MPSLCPLPPPHVMAPMAPRAVSSPCLTSAHPPPSRLHAGGSHGPGPRARLSSGDPVGLGLGWARLALGEEVR